MPGLIGKKIGMTSVFGADGKNMMVMPLYSLPMTKSARSMPASL